MLIFGFVGCTYRKKVTVREKSEICHKNIYCGRKMLAIVCWRNIFYAHTVRI